MRKDITTSLLAVIVLTLLLGLAYPLAVTAVSQMAFPNKSDGSQIERDGKCRLARDRPGVRALGRERKKTPRASPSSSPTCATSSRAPP